MEYVTLPNSDLRVSPVCLGTWQFNGGEMSADKTWAGQPEEVSKEIVDKAIEQGINFFDTAEGYLNSQSVLGRLLAGRRRDVVIATKFGTRVPVYGPEDVEVSLTNSLQKLQTDYIDLYQIHWPSFINDSKAIFDELKRQQAKGRIRNYGVCNFGPQNMKDAQEANAKMSTNQLPYSLLWRPIEYDILPVCEAQGVGVLAYSPLQQGLLSGKYTKLEDVPEGRRRTRLFNSASTNLSKHGTDGMEKQLFQTIADIKSVCNKAEISMPKAALAWVLQNPIVKSVIVGARTPEQVVHNVELAKLKQEVVRELSDASADLKELVGKNADLWAPTSRIS